MDDQNNEVSTGGTSKSNTAGECGAPFEAMEIGMVCYLLDEDLTILWANDCFYRENGYTREEYQSRFQSLRQYFAQASDEFATLKSGLNAPRPEGGRGVKLTVRIPHRAGGFTWFRITGSVTGQNADGCPIFRAVHTEIGDLIDQREQLARQHQERARNFEWMMDEYEGNVYISDLETYELLYLNRVACATLQVPLKKLLGRKCYEAIQGRDSPCPFCTNDRLTEDEFYEWEFFNPVLDRTFMIKNRVVNWEGHHARIELSHDMYSAEYKLAKKDQEREAMLRSIPGGLVRVDARDLSTILWYGANFLEMIGYTQEQFEKELHSQCTYIHPDDMGRLVAVMQEICETGQDAILETRMLTRSKEVRILTITLCYVSGENSWDGVPSIYSIGIDITKERAEQSRQRKALEDACQTARVANAAKTNFLSSMSHDIRTPMNAIMGMAAIAQANLTSPEKVRDCLGKINVSSRHLLSLINEVLDMSKIESGKIDLMPEEVGLPELIQNVADLCRPLITEKNQEFQMSVGRIRHERVIADGDRLQQVLTNLLSNAIKYTREGGTISLRISELFSPIPKKGQYEFVFTDNGIGMSREYLPHIFEPFSRAEDSRISKIQGTGLGMAITENIVRMMNGTIEVKSALGVGSEFIVSIPLEVCAETEPRADELVGLPVLVVDDDQIVCENATALLNELGMRGCWVLSGIQAIELVTQAHQRADDFFAVILDWKMPEMDGLETVRAIRMRLGDHVPIIIISAYDYSSIEEEFLRAGADAFITKPLFKSKMLHVLQLFCASNRIDSPAVPREEELPVLFGKRVLLAEDNDLNREIAVELLEMHGIHVDAVENGRRAVDTFAASSPGDYLAILMDIQMPVLDGYGATAEIRSLKREDAHTIPILALTANAFASDVGRARSVGMNDHIAKPIDLERLIDALQRWVKI